MHDTIVESSPAALIQRVNSPEFDLLRYALLPVPLEAPLDAAPQAASEHLRFDRYEANRLSLSVHAAGRALLVLSELDYPGWRATVNDRPARIWNVNGALRGVVVPEGDNRVSLQYRPASIYVGAVLSLVSFGSVLAVCIWLWVRRSSPPPSP